MVVVTELMGPVVDEVDVAPVVIDVVVRGALVIDTGLAVVVVECMVVVGCVVMVALPVEVVAGLISHREPV